MLKCVLFIVFLIGLISMTQARNMTEACGKDNSPISVVYEGYAKIDIYPWMGYLFYPLGKKRYTSVVVLVAKQLVIGTATEIDKLPKVDFRRRARVVLGRNCLQPAFRVRDYAYHPDYTTNTYSAIAIIQLEVDNVRDVLRPVCPPPKFFIEPQFYAMTLSDNCKNPLVKLYEMEYVDPDECKSYYRRSGLDMDSFWPTHTACARALSGGECVWRSGAVLVARQANRWLLLGFGIYGPGCEAPARFMDYGMYHQWITMSILRIGKPTVSRISENEVILRRSLSNVQRYGPCDPEERQMELYSDETKVDYHTFTGGALKTVRYNMTIYAGVEYSCVIFRAHYFHKWDRQPKLHLRRWCAGATGMCFDFQFTEIDFYVEIHFDASMNYTMRVYGKQAFAMDVPKVMKYVNTRRSYPWPDPLNKTASMNYTLRAFGRRAHAMDVPRVMKYTNKLRAYPVPPKPLNKTGLYYKK